MSEDLEEELNIIEERNREKKPILELALSIDEPIDNILFREPVIVKRNIKVSDAIILFNEKDVGCVLVVDDRNKLIGIFTERDVIRKLITKGLDINKEAIENHMTKKPDSLYLSDPIAYALNRMAAGGYRHVPLVNEQNEPVGFLSVRDIIDHLADYYSNEILNLPPSPHTKQLSRDGG